MGKFNSKAERLTFQSNELSSILEAMEMRYNAVLDNLIANDTKANRQAEKMLFLRISEIRKELKGLELELSTIKGKRL